MGRGRSIILRSKGKTLVTLLLAVCLSGCDSSMQSIVDSHAEQYAKGKTTESYSVDTVGKLLDELLEKYTGGVTEPELGTDDEYDEWKKETESTEGTEETEGTNRTDVADVTEEPVEETFIPDEVTNRDDLYAIVYSTLHDTKEEVSFHYSSSFDTALLSEVIPIVQNIERISPMDATAVSHYWYSYSNGECTLSFEYRFSISETKRMKDAANQAVDDIVRLLDVSGKSEYEIVVAVDQYLCDHVYYPEEEPYKDVEYTAYGALVNGCSVCEGYAGAVKMLLAACGVEADIEIGVCTNGEGHAWNLVKVDGQWYQLDTCWNDGGMTKDYFLVSDNYMKYSRTWESGNYPACSASYAEKAAA